MVCGDRSVTGKTVLTVSGLIDAEQQHMRGRSLVALLNRISLQLRRLLNNEYQRSEWIQRQLQLLPPGSRILDAGCGRQPYRAFCRHLAYYAQDFGRYEMDEKESLTAAKRPYVYGRIDYTGNIWEIDEQDAFFDAILCTEVFEHIPYPNRALAEFARLLKGGGRLILTVPSNALRHMDPFFYYSGFTDRFLTLALAETGFHDVNIVPEGSYHAWLMVEEARTMRHEGFFAWLALWPAFIYHYLRQRRATEKEINTLCFGYYVTAVKGPGGSP